VTLSPLSINPTPVSKPIKPAPIIIADFAPDLIAASIFSPSFILRSEKIPGLSLPLIGGINGSAPVAMTKLSYSNFSTASLLVLIVIVFSFVLMAVTSVSKRKFSLSIWK